MKLKTQKIVHSAVLILCPYFSVMFWVGMNMGFGGVLEYILVSAVALFIAFLFSLLIFMFTER